MSKENYFIQLKQSRSFYTWQDMPYRDFMMQVLRALEPRFYKKHTIIIDELDEMLEVVFIQKGDTLIGYQVNKQKRYCIKYTDKCVIGAFGCTFNQRAAFIYACYNDNSGYSIRKEKWKEMIESNDEIGSIVRKNVLIEYITQIRSKVLIKKRQAIRKAMERKDY